MKELGRVLREKREQLGLDLNQVQSLTKIRKRYLMALEDGDWSILPGDVYARGFVRSYAECLGLDGRTLLEQYVETQNAGSEPTPVAEAPKTTPASDVAPEPENRSRDNQAPRRTVQAPIRQGTRSARPRTSRKGNSAMGQAIAVVAALVVLGGAWWAIARHDKSPGGPDANTAAVNQTEPNNVVPSNTTSDNAAGGTNQTANVAGNQTSPAASNQPQPQVVAQSFQNNVQTYTVKTSQPMNVVLTAANDDCWVKVTADGNVIDGSDTVSHGQSKTWQANQSMTIRVGNVPAVTLTINGQSVTLPNTTSAIDVQIVKAQA